MNKHSSQSTLMVVFGASGDLARRKLMPSLYSLARQKLLPADFTVLGFARTPYSDDDYRKLVRDSVVEHMGSAIDSSVLDALISKVHYMAGNYDDQAAFERLKERITELGDKSGQADNLLFYLATPPNVFEPIATLLAGVGLSNPTTGWTRLIIEKPFGHDLTSAQALNKHLLGLFSEDQIYRIDHYLGKETVQNILVFRFGNGIFEPVWNRNYIDHVQITVAETLDIGDRGGYFDKAGTIRDMVQNHMMQLVALTAMEPPVAFDAKSVRDQKVNVLRSIRPIDPADVDRWVVRAQYGGGVVKGQKIQSYLLADEVAEDSTTDTFVAWKLEIDNWRWNGVPFYLRTGKALAQKLTEVQIVFRKPPLLLFEHIDRKMHVPSNVITLRIQPDESIFLSFDAKRPGPKVDLDSVRMSFSYNQVFGDNSGDAYERLLLDAMLGDGTLFIRRDEIEVAWDRVSRVLDGWQAQADESTKAGHILRLPQYAPGSWGPKEADDLLKQDRRYWRNP